MRPITLLPGLVIAGLITAGTAAAGCGDMYNALAPASSPAVASSGAPLSSELQIAADQGQAYFDHEVESVILQVGRDMRQQAFRYGAVASFSAPSRVKSEAPLSSALQIAADEGQAGFDQDLENVILQVARDMRQDPAQYAELAVARSPLEQGLEVVVSSELQVAADEGQAQYVRRSANQLSGLSSEIQNAIDEAQLSYDVAISAVWDRDIVLSGNVVWDPKS